LQHQVLRGSQNKLKRTTREKGKEKASGTKSPSWEKSGRQKEQSKTHFRLNDGLVGASKQAKMVKGEKREKKKKTNAIGRDARGKKQCPSEEDDGEGENKITHPREKRLKEQMKSREEQNRLAKKRRREKWEKGVGVAEYRSKGGEPR